MPMPLAGDLLRKFIAFSIGYVLECLQVFPENIRSQIVRIHVALPLLSR
jgi:hypothetical protein